MRCQTHREGYGDGGAEPRLLAIVLLLRSKSTKAVALGRQKLAAHLSTCGRLSHTDFVTPGREVICLRSILNNHAPIIMSFWPCGARLSSAAMKWLPR